MFLIRSYVIFLREEESPQTDELSQTTVYSRQSSLEPENKTSQCCCKTVEIDNIQAQNRKGLVDSLIWSRDWRKINPGEKIQQVTSIFWDKWNNKELHLSPGNDFPPFYLQSNMQKSNQRIIWINEVVCPSLQRPDGGGGQAGTFTAEAVSSGGGSRHPTTGLTPAPQTVQMATLIPQRDYNLTDRISLLILRDLLPTRRMPPAGWSRIPGKCREGV